MSKDATGPDRLGKDYVCPQCGPDPRGEAEHAENRHTWPPRRGGDDLELNAHLREQALTLVQDIPRRREEQAEIERALVRSARTYGVTWNEIAAATRMSAGWMARELYEEPEPEGETDGT